MPRVKRGVTSKRRHNRILRQAKGYYGGRSNLIKTAREAVEKGWK
jgi:large subunit ribosomal protein L20